MNITFKKIKEMIVNVTGYFALTLLLCFFFKYVGGYKQSELKTVIFSTIFIPIIVMFSNYAISSKLNEEDILEKYIKQNDLFYEKGLITTKQYKSYLNDLEKRIQNLPRYKSRYK